MQRKIILSLVAMTYSFVGPAAAADKPRAAMTTQRPGIRLAKPHWAPLNDQQLRVLIAGRAVSIDNDYEIAPKQKLNTLFIGGCPPTETFFEDGRWQRGICARTYQVTEGRWRIDVAQGVARLCINRADAPEECRLVWQGAPADQIYMSLASTTNSGDYLPYRIKQQPIQRTR